MSEPVKVAAKHAQLHLRRLFCDRALFAQEFVPIDIDAPKPSEGYAVEITFELKPAGDSNHQFSVRVGLEVEPDIDLNQPYRIEVAYVGDFEFEASLESEEMEGIARTNCAAILMPYVRQAVTDLSSRGTNGPLLLKPMNIAAMLAGATPVEPDGD